MLKDFHQHQEPPPGFGRHAPGLLKTSLRLPFSREQILILLVSVFLLVLLINLWSPLFRTKLRRLAKIQVVSLQDRFIQHQLQELPIEAREEFIQGVEAYRLKHWPRAETHFLRTLQDVPEQSDLHVLVGLVKLYRNRLEEAIFHLKMALRGNTALREEAMWNLAQAYLLKGKLDEARKLLQPLAAANGSFADHAREQLQQLRD